MIPYLVTLTGADETVDPGDLRALSEEYSIVEWGVLLDEKNSGKKNRYPGKDWTNQFVNAFKFVSFPTSISAHLCGETCNAFIREKNMIEYATFNRVQLNFPVRNGEVSTSINDLADCLRECEDTEHEIILQFNEQTKHLWKAASPFFNYGLLHDASRGTGLSLLSSNIPRPVPGFRNGYAGGIGPDNIEEVLNELHYFIPKGYIWFDMETSLRNSRDEFDLVKCKDVLDQVEEWVETNQ